jgi:hypothetical protein
MNIIQRRYPEQQWDYKAVSIVINGKDIIYYTLINKNKKSKGVEIYSGSNYVAPFSVYKKSYSRTYSLANLPISYKHIVSNLIKTHNTIKWSKDKYVNIN